MLATEPDCVPSAKPGVKKHVPPHPLMSANGPSLVVCDHVILSPSDEAVRFWSRWVLDAKGRIVLDVLCLERPTEQSPHRIEEITALCGGVCPTLSASDDGLGGGSGEQIVPRCFRHLLEDVLPLATGCRTQRRPVRSLPITLNEPCQRSSGR